MHVPDPFIELRRLVETAEEQLLNERSDRPNLTIDENMVENDYMDSYQNESYSGHEKNDFANPFDYYSPFDFGYPSADEHVDKVKVEDHVDEVKVEEHVEAHFAELVDQTRNVIFHESTNDLKEGKKDRIE